MLRGLTASRGVASVLKCEDCLDRGGEGAAVEFVDSNIDMADTDLGKGRFPLPVSFLTNRLLPHSSWNSTSSNPGRPSYSSMACSSTRSIRCSASRMTKTKISLMRSERWT
jgi:hypothetical protein